ncbi:MAG: hypothetical protein JWL76_1973 [Thermoleophilia bacterium]|nr:hypothetical protein [Thermoleophilia bacterium]
MRGVLLRRLIVDLAVPLTPALVEAERSEWHRSRVTGSEDERTIFRPMEPRLSGADQQRVSLPHG